MPPGAIGGSSFKYLLGTRTLHRGSQGSIQAPLRSEPSRRGGDVVEPAPPLQFQGATTRTPADPRKSRAISTQSPRHINKTTKNHNYICRRNSSECGRATRIFLSVNHHEPKGPPSTRATRSGDPGYERRSWAARERPELTKEGCKGTRGTSQREGDWARRSFTSSVAKATSPPSRTPTAAQSPPQRQLSAGEGSCRPPATIHHIPLPDGAGRVLLLRDVARGPTSRGRPLRRR